MSAALSERPWLPPTAAERVRTTLAGVSDLERDGVRLLAELVAENRRIHDETCVNLNPATNRMNPRAEQMLAAGLGSRASLGYPGEKYETGLEAIEQIEVLAAELCARVFHASYAEVRVGSGALANLYAFMIGSQPGDTIIAPPASIAGHVTHHGDGAAGLFGLTTVPAPVDPRGYTVDVAGLARLAREVRPAMITIGGSLNLVPHPVAAIREVADEVGATLLFDAAHLGGVIAGGAWPNPLDEGAHLMSMSTYKSLGGPPGGLLLTNEPGIAERMEAIAYPGLTANFDAGKTAALAQTMLDWLHAGRDYAATMVENARMLAEHLAAAGLPVHGPAERPTRSHQLALEAAAFGGGQTASAVLRRANLLTSGIGLPVDDGDVNGLRIGTPEVTRLGMLPDDMATLGSFLVRALADIADAAAVERVGAEVTEWRQQFRNVHYTTDVPAPAPSAAG